MPRYLLSTQTVIDIALQDGGPAARWFEDADKRNPPIAGDDIFISAVTPAVLTADLNRKPPTPELVAVRSVCAIIIERFVDAGQVVNVTKSIADRWFDLIASGVKHHLRDGRVVEYSSGEKIVLATAIVGTDGFPYTLVTRKHEGLNSLQALGLAIEDPAELYP